MTAAGHEAATRSGRGADGKTDEQRVLREGYKARYGEQAEHGGGPGLHAVEERHRPGDPGSGLGENR